MPNFADRVPAQQPQVRREESRTQSKVLAGTEAGNDMRNKLQRMADSRFERRQAERAAQKSAAQASSAKLEVGSAFDPLEAEADRAAQEVVHGKSTGGDLSVGAQGGGQGKAQPLAMRITRKVQRKEEEAQMRAMREEDDSAQMKAQREEDEAQMRAMREEDESAQMKAQREEDEAQLRAMREEDESAQMKAQREEDEAQMRAMREEDESAQMRAQREEDEAQMRAMREEDESAQMKAQREEDEAQMRAMREEDESAQMKAQREEDEAQMRAQREEDEAQMRAMREEDESAQMKAQREEDEAQMRAMREEDDSAQMRAQREEDEAQMRAQREEDEAQMRAMREEEEAQLKAAPQDHLNGFTAEADTAALLKSRKGKGEPLSGPLKAEMEQGFGTDLSNVRIHKDAPAEKLNQDLKAKAFTVGGDVFFNKGQFDPATKGGKELIAHELAHTVQQGAVKPGKEPEGAALGPGQEQKVASPGGGVSIPAAQGGTGIATPPADTGTPAPEAEAPQEQPKAEEEKKEEEKDKKEGEGEAKAELPDSPKDPEEDPAFQAVLATNAANAQQQAVHSDPATEVAELQGAAVLPEDQQAEEADMEGHMGAMEEVAEQQERKPFTPATFKEKLKANLDELEKQLPNDADSAEEFKEEEPIGAVKEDIAGQVAEEKDAIAGPLEATSGAAEPPATGAPTVAEVPLEPEDPGPMAPDLDPAAAVPKPFADHEISMEEESASLDEKMAENNVTEEQLEKSNEPEFLEGLSKKREAQQKAAEAPGVYRGQEAGILDQARGGALEQGQEAAYGMLTARVEGFGAVMGGQVAGETTSETEQDRIKAEFQKIYDRTKDEVNRQLEAITTQVTELFDTEAETAKTTFEENVEEKLDDIYGVTVIDDWLFGEDTEAIEKVFVEEKATFVSTMDGVLDRIATIIADGLNGALATIAKGREESQVFYDGLDESQKKLAEESFTAFNDQYTALEDTVYEKEDELARDLAQSYKDNVDGLRESFDKIKEEVAAGWIGGALNALVGIIETIIKIGEMLTELLSAVVEAVGAILSDPIGFLSNLIDGVKLGFEQFFTNIKTHIISGLIEWLTGSLGGVGITMPDDIFSLGGVFDLTMQILGLGWDFLREKAVKLLGEPVVQAMEVGAELFIKLKNGGIDALWEELKDQFQDIQAVVMDAIRDMVITKVVEAGIKWIMGLLSPAGAFIKAAMMVIDIVTFFVERAASIIDLVMAFIDGIRALANGDVSSVANAIEKALAKAIPILIGFLAALVGVTGLAGKVQNIVKKIRKRVDKAVTKVIKKIGKKFKKGKGKGIKEVTTDQDKKKHKKIGTAVEKQLKKKPKKKGLSFEELYALKTKEAAALEQKYQKELRGNVKINITTGKLSEEQKDGDLDFNISIAPNDYKKKISVGDLDEVVMPQFEVGNTGPSPIISEVGRQRLGSLKIEPGKYPQVYLGQVISVPNKAITRLPMKYAQQAFGSKEEAQERFGMVIGLNLYKDVAGNNKEKVQQGLAKFNPKHKYPLGVIGLLWEPAWKGTVNGKPDQPISPEQIKGELDKLSGDEKTKAEKAVQKAEKQIRKPGTKFVPYGALRDKVNQDAYTSTISGELKQNAEDVYVHLGDADAVNLKSSGGASTGIASMFGGLDIPLFKAYDSIIAKASRSGGPKPAVVSGGYRFEVDGRIGQGDQLRVLANQMDQEFREAVGRIDPSILYFPEPNTLVKLQGKNLEVSFGVGRNEGETMMNALIAKRNLGVNDVTFDTSASVETRSTRFYAKIDAGGKSKKINGQVFAFVNGQLEGKGITLEQFTAMFKADQMHATRSKFVSRIIATNRYPALTGKEDRQSAVLESAYNILFPHTSILGAKMRNKVNWMNIKTLLPTTTPSSAAATALSTLSQAYDPAIAAQLLALMSAGAEAVHAYMTKLFASNDPK